MSLIRYVGTSIAIKSLTHSSQTFDPQKTTGEVYPLDVFSLPLYGSGARLAFQGAKFLAKRFARFYLRQARRHPYRTGVGTGLVASQFVPKVTPSKFYQERGGFYGSFSSRRNYNRSYRKSRRFCKPCNCKRSRKSFYY